MKLRWIRIGRNHVFATYSDYYPVLLRKDGIWRPTVYRKTGIFSGGIEGIRRISLKRHKNLRDAKKAIQTWIDREEAK